MSIFGKKSNQPTPELPPELRPFYGQQKPSSLKPRRWLAITLLVVIVAAAVVFGLWLHGRNTSLNQPKPSTSKQLSTANNGNHSTPAQSSSPSTTQTNPAVSPPPVQSTTTPAQSTPSGTAIPNTGPGTNVLLASAGAGLLGAILYHVRQVRTSSNRR